MTRTEVWQSVRVPEKWIRNRVGRDAWESVFTGDVQLRLCWNRSEREPYEEDWATSYGEAWRFRLRLMYGCSLVAAIWVAEVAVGGDGGMVGGTVCLPCPRPGTHKVPRRIYKVVRDHIPQKEDIERYFEESGLDWEDDAACGYEDDYGEDESEYQFVDWYERVGTYEFERESEDECGSENAGQRAGLAPGAGR